MKRVIIAGIAVAALTAAAGGGFMALRGHLHSTETALVSPALAQSSEEPIYFQDPDGRPFYSLTPKKTSDGRDYRAVPAGADLSFEDGPAAAPRRYLADPEEGFDGDGLHPHLRGRRQ
jgi:Cu(I)/Ag(I) efflux system membrane fusion protein